MQFIECMIHERMELELPVGKVIPKYTYTAPRDKYRNSVVWYPSGGIRSVYLEERTSIVTPFGTIPAELITFYESGAIKRIFPLYGQISGYWTEEEEDQLTEGIALDAGVVKGTYRLLCVSLYESGAIKSFTFWKGEEIPLQVVGNKTPIKARIGISFYETGQIQSIEPVQGSVVKTPFGFVWPYDSDPLGMIGDQNSLEFDQEGRIIAFSSIVTGICVTRKNDSWKQEIDAKLLPSLLEEEAEAYVPIHVKYTKDGVEIRDSYGVYYQYELEEYIVETKQYHWEGNISSCECCTACKNGKGRNCKLH